MHKTTSSVLAALTLAAGLSFAAMGSAFAQDAAPAPGAGATAPAQTEAPAGTKTGQAEPRNEVGDKFELPRMSSDNHIEMIGGLCKVSMGGLGEEGCSCLAERSRTELTDIQRDYLIAAGMAPPVADRMLADGRIGASDEATIKTFLDTSYETCMPEGAAAPADATPPAVVAPNGGAAATPEDEGARN